MWRLLLAPDAEPTAGDEPDVGDEAPEPLSLSDDAQVAWDGLDEPLTGKEIREGYLRNSDYTKKSQELAQQRKAIERQIAEAQQWQQYARQLEQHYQRQQQQPQNGQQPQGSSADQVFQQMEELYGPEYTNHMRQLAGVFGQQLGSLTQQQQQLLQAMSLWYPDYIQTKRALHEIKSSRMGDRETATIDAALKKAGIPDDARDAAREFAMDMLRSFEPDYQSGETIEQYLEQFPEMFGSRSEKLLKIARAMDKAQLKNAKRGLPGKGGAGTPSKPLKPTEDVNDIVDMFEPEGGWKR